MSAVVFFCFCLCALAGVVVMRSGLNKVNLEAVNASFHFTVRGPELSLSMVGHNPLPFSVRAVNAQVRMVVASSPVQANWRFKDRTILPAGDFSMPLSALEPAEGSLRLSVPKDIRSLPGEEFPFEGIVVVALGPFKKRIPFRGIFRFSMGTGG